MKWKNLSLYNFRNFSQVERLDIPEHGLLIAAAPNATGKTNFLESVYMLLRGRSWRANHASCVQWGSDSFIVAGDFESNKEEHSVAIRYHQPTRKLRIEEDGEPASLVTFYNHYPLILFLPEDTFMFARGPAVRRNFINSVLVGSSGYVSALVQFQRALKQRNTLLKKVEDWSSLAAWTEILIEQSVAVWQQRDLLSHFFATHLSGVYQQLSGEKVELAVTLSRTATETSLRSKLEQSFNNEKKFGYTMQGPHRDDLLIEVEGEAVGDIFSQGQLRSLAIALKLSAHQFLTSTTQERPLLLLDEVLSELDEERQQTLLDNVPAGQSLLTTTQSLEALKDRSDVHFFDIRKIVSVAPDSVSTSSPKVEVEQLPTGAVA